MTEPGGAADLSEPLDARTLVGAPATQIAAAVRAGRVTARAVVAAHLDHIATVDEKYGAFRRVRADEALREADAVDIRPDRFTLPLAGVPVAIKDHVTVHGEYRGDGSLATVRTPARHDHPLVARWRAAGAVVVGLTRVPELCIFPTSDDPDGMARSPWDVRYSAGGSSGGAAAAVAAAMVPLAHGSDGMGSIRIPAACCGVLGVKPSTGVTPHVAGEGWLGLSEHGVLATTPDDAALGLAVMAGQEPDQWSGGDGVPLRIAVATRSPVVFARPDAETVDAVRRAARALIKAGHSTIAAHPRIPVTVQTLAGAYWTAAPAAEVPADLDVSLLQQRTRVHLAIGRAAARFGLADPDARERWRDRAVEFFTGSGSDPVRGFDLLLTPVLARHPAEAAAWSTRRWWPNARMSSLTAPYPNLWNLAGFPAAAVPAGVRSDGAPASVQLVAAPGREDLLFQAARALATWDRHPPAITALTSVDG
jgi:amidase